MLWPPVNARTTMERGSGRSRGKAALMADGETAWWSGAGTVPALDVTKMQGRNAMVYRWELRRG